MKLRTAIAIFALSAAVVAETPSVCPAERAVDEIIAEIHRLQAKKNNRNKNPLPTVSCIWGWCRKSPKTPPTVPQPAPTADAPSGGVTSESSSKDANAAVPGESSSKQSSAGMALSECDIATENALQAAHNVEVADYYFDQQNYRAAALRYKEALEKKPNDAAIEVRLGRAFEKLKQTPEAMEHYAAAEKVGGPEKWVEEARTALARLEKK